VSTNFTTKAHCHCGTKTIQPRQRLLAGLKNWRRDPESNRAKRICNPLHNRFAIAPQAYEKGKPGLPFLEIGAGKESRTLDLNLGKVALYQLSYSRISSLEL
jgi:hypothetical protein